MIDRDEKGLDELKTKALKMAIEHGDALLCLIENGVSFNRSKKSKKISFEFACDEMKCRVEFEICKCGDLCNGMIYMTHPVFFMAHEISFENAQKIIETLDTASE